MHVETEITTSITASPIMYMSRPPKTDVINYISNVIFAFDITTAGGEKFNENNDKVQSSIFRIYNNYQ
jgi:hypothetical protein